MYKTKYNHDDQGERIDIKTQGAVRIQFRQKRQKGRRNKKHKP